MKDGGLQDRRPAPGGARTEGFCLALLLALGLLPRLAFVTLFPTRPVSDFVALVDFALLLRNVSLTASDWHWDFFNPGLPLVLSLLFRIFPGSPEAIARLATAVLTGLVPVLPFVLWRGALPLRSRLLAGGLLAVWPGQIVFSGVVAQDNWVLFPVVALGALAARSLARGQGHPLAAGLLYAFGVAIRQEMLVVLVPLAAASLGGRNGGRWKRALLACALAAGIPLLLLALQRQAATGRFALTTEHTGFSILGAYLPGATVNAWTNPGPYLASVQPSLLQDPEEAQRQGIRLALREALRRPVFHAARITAFTLDFITAGEVANLYWSLLAPEVLPPSHQARAQAFFRFVGPLLKIDMTLFLALFLATLLITPVRRSPAVWALSAAIALKVGLHAITAAQGRYFLPVTALQILVIGLGAREAADRPRRRVVAAVAAGAVVATGLALLAPGAVARVRARDVDGPRTYRFTLTTRKHGGTLACGMDRGRLTDLYRSEAAIETFQRDPSPGETATVACELTGPKTPVPLVLRLYDAYALGGLPGRMVTRVAVDESEVLRRDLAAEPGVGWMDVPLGRVGPGTRRKVLIEVVAVHPDPGAAWGKAANVRFRLDRSEETR
jgi:hypothetical protein